jgi:hypothetical protein
MQKSAIAAPAEFVLLGRKFWFGLFLYMHPQILITLTIIALATSLAAKEPKELQTARERYEQSSSHTSEADRQRYVTGLARLREKLASDKTSDGWQAVDAEIRRHPAPKNSDAKALSKILAGEWASPRHDYLFRSDGTHCMLMDGSGGVDGRWRIEGNQFIEYSATDLSDKTQYTILLLTEKDFIFTGEEAGEPVFYETRISGESRGRSAESSERYPETATRLLQPGDIKGWEEAKLRYAINEIYARHGADFKDKKIKEWFLRLGWYHPRPGLTYDQAEAEFSDVEKENVKLLGEARGINAHGISEPREPSGQTAGKEGRLSDTALRRKVVGYWTGPRYARFFRPDGQEYQYHSDTTVPWDVKAGLFYEASDAYDILLLSDQEFVYRFRGGETITLRRITEKRAEAARINR